MLFTEADVDPRAGGRPAERRQPLPPRAPRGRARGPRRRLRPRRHALALAGRARAGAERRPDRRARDGPRRRGPRAPRRRRPAARRGGRALRGPRPLRALRAPPGRPLRVVPRAGPSRRAACRSSSASGATSRTTSTSGGARARSASRPPTSSPASTRSGAPSTTSTRTSSASRGRRGASARPSGSRSSRGTGGATGAPSTRGWATSPPSSPARRAPARSSSPGPSAWPGYIPFDEKTQAFAEPAAGAFFPLNLSALSPTLIESELFGHRRGAFTGALEDRKGWFEACPPLGAVFLDEIGDVEPGDPGEAPARPPDADVPAPRRHGRPDVRGEAHRRHEPGSPPGARRRPLPGGLLLPALRRPPGHAVPRRAAPGHAGRAPDALPRDRPPRRGRRGGRTTSPRKPRPGSPRTSDRTTPGPATCGSSSSASGTS